MRIIDLTAEHEQAVLEVAELLVAAFPQAWPTTEAAVEEIHESFGPERLSRVALDAGSHAVGWIGGISQYDGNVWELHPLVVRTDMRSGGIGRALVADLEARVRERDGHIIWLGTDDEFEQTSLSGVDLFPNVYEHIAAIKNIRRHPYEFYQKLGYVIVGVLPDANGPGKPDIFMAKRL
jgi:aminoglycoside 6'-N-acetyltransferase I